MEARRRGQRDCNIVVGGGRWIAEVIAREGMIDDR
jgi:hypothetical protein